MQKHEYESECMIQKISDCGDKLLIVLRRCIYQELLPRVMLSLSVFSTVKRVMNKIFFAKYVEHWLKKKGTWTFETCKQITAKTKIEANLRNQCSMRKPWSLCVQVCSNSVPATHYSPTAHNQQQVYEANIKKALHFPATLGMPAKHPNTQKCATITRRTSRSGKCMTQHPK